MCYSEVTQMSTPSILVSWSSGLGMSSEGACAEPLVWGSVCGARAARAGVDFKSVELMRRVVDGE